MRIWKHPINLEFINSLSKNTINEVIGVEFIEFGDDYLLAKMPVDNRTKQPRGLLHGGATMVLVETLGSVASVLCIDDVSKQSIVGLEINGNHLKAVKEGFVTGKVTPIRIGRKVHVWRVEVYNQDKQLINSSRLTTMVLDL